MHTETTACHEKACSVSPKRASSLVQTAGKTAPQALLTHSLHELVVDAADTSVFHLVTQSIVLTGENANFAAHGQRADDVGIDVRLIANAQRGHRARHRLRQL